MNISLSELQKTIDEIFALPDDELIKAVEEAIAGCPESVTLEEALKQQKEFRHET